jgi:hypothetical protein
VLLCWFSCFVSSILQKYQAIAARNKQSVAQAEANAALGSIHSAAGDHGAACGHFERTFDIAKQVGDRALVDSARINLGMARGNMSLGSYMSNITKDNIPALLNWKTRSAEDYDREGDQGKGTNECIARAHSRIISYFFSGPLPQAPAVQASQLITLPRFPATPIVLRIEIFCFALMEDDFFEFFMQLI